MDVHEIVVVREVPALYLFGSLSRDEDYRRKTKIVGEDEACRRKTKTVEERRRLSEGDEDCRRKTKIA